MKRNFATFITFPVVDTPTPSLSKHHTPLPPLVPPYLFSFHHQPQNHAPFLSNIFRRRTLRLTERRAFILIVTRSITAAISVLHRFFSSVRKRMELYNQSSLFRSYNPRIWKIWALPRPKSVYKLYLDIWHRKHYAWWAKLHNRK